MEPGASLAMRITEIYAFTKIDEGLEVVEEG
jgi:hypothetical protein